MRMRRVFLAILFALASVLLFPGRSNAVDNCTEGTWNFRIAASWGCTYGHVSDVGQGTSNHRLELNVTVTDLASDGLCVYLRAKWVDSALDPISSKRGTTCGYGNTTTVQTTLYFNGYDAIELRLCRADSGTDTCDPHVWTYP